MGVLLFTWITLKLLHGVKDILFGHSFRWLALLCSSKNLLRIEFQMYLKFQSVPIHKMAACGIRASFHVPLARGSLGRELGGPSCAARGDSSACRQSLVREAHQSAGRSSVCTRRAISSV